MLNGTVVSCDRDYLDNYIIDKLKDKGKENIYRFIAYLINNPFLPYVTYPDFIYVNLIENLEKRGKITSYIIDGIKYIELTK